MTDMQNPAVPEGAQADLSTQQPSLPPYPSEEDQPGTLPPPYSPPPCNLPPSHQLPYPLSPEEASMEATDQCSALRTTEPNFEENEAKSSWPQDKTIRRAFVRKVFTIVTLQLLFTFSMVCVFTFSTVVKKAVQNNLWVYLASYIIFLVVCICLSFCRSFSRRHPWNLVGLTVVTLSLTYVVGTVASFYDTPAVLIAMGTTLVISFAVIMFSAQSKVDFTLCSGILLVLALDLLMFGFFSCFYYSSILQVVYGCLGALLYALFLAVDCQLVMGRDTYALSPEEYVFAALVLYVDVITIFLYLLMLLGGGSRN